MDRPNSIKATLMGITALLLWAMSTVVLSELKNIPTFQLSGTVFLIAFLLSCIRLTKRREWSQINPSLLILSVGFFAILNNQAAYVYSIKLIPPEQAEIIYYLWPIIAVIISTLFLEKSQTEKSEPLYFIAAKSIWKIIKHQTIHRKSMEENENENAIRALLYAFSKQIPLLSALLGLSGVYLLLADGEGIGEIFIDRSEGYFFAFISAGAWVLYSLFNKYHPNIHQEMNGIWCGMAAIPCFIINSYCEEGLVMPSAYEWLLLLVIGIGSLSYSLKMWTIGIKFGHFNALSVFSYLSPLISVLVLMATGKTPLKSNILIACQLVILGAILCSLVEWLKKRSETSVKEFLFDTEY